MCISSEKKVKVAQSNSSRPHGIVHGIVQARILEWVAYLFSRRSSQPRNRTQVSFVAGGFFTSWATREVLGDTPKWTSVACGQTLHASGILAILRKARGEGFLIITETYTGSLSSSSWICLTQQAFIKYLPWAHWVTKIKAMRLIQAGISKKSSGKNGI